MKRVLTILVFLLLAWFLSATMGCSNNHDKPTENGTGLKWKSRVSNTLSSLYSVAWSGSVFVAVGQAGTVVSSTDGVTWHASNAAADMVFADVVWGNGKFVAVGSRYNNIDILRSSDGTEWTEASAIPSVHGTLECIIYTGTSYIAVGGDAGSILTSVDGDSWTEKFRDDQMRYLGIAWSGTRYTAVGVTQCIQYLIFCGTVATSSDLHQWSYFPLDRESALGGVVWTGTQFVVIGADPQGGVILTSPDGSTWTEQSRPDDRLYGVLSLGTLIVAVGSNGTILTSSDGRSWNHQLSGTTKELYSATYSDDLVVVVGYGGTILTAPYSKLVAHSSAIGTFTMTRKCR